MIYQQDYLDSLITIPKTIIEGPHTDWQEHKGHFRNAMKLKWEQDEIDFFIFMRQSIEFPENFAIGLIFIDTESGRKILLIRFNGPHGDCNSTKSNDTHFHYHIHQIRADLLMEGRDPLSIARHTGEYASYEEAILYFCKYTNIIGFEKYFPKYSQHKLFKSEE